MAGVARKSRGVLGRVNLGEIHGLRVIRLMATNAKHRRIEFRRDDACRIFRVLHLRAVTRFAGNVSVSSRFLHIQNVAVAGFTHLVPGVRNRLRLGFSKRIPSIVAICAKALRNQQASHNQEQRQSNGKNRR